MSTSAVLNSAADASRAPTREGCRACKRTGLPILPLRSAIVGTGDKAVSDGAGLSKVPTAEGLRTLRTGYLYVLLDNRLWQAYEVTPEGCLRQFNPSESPRSEPEPLSRACIAQGHDIASSFLHIDADRFKTAWIAFASDPWTRNVLDAYRTGRAPAQRFVKVDLKAARENPSSVGLAMTPGALQVDTQVWEYAQSSQADLDSVHGFHSRHDKREGLRDHVRTAAHSHQLPQGVLALVLDDTVGRVQELNAMRARWVATRQQWAEEPERQYRLLTSQTLRQIKKLNAANAVAATPGFEPITGDGPPVFRDPKLERQEEITRKTLAANQSLEERYKEADRAKFQQEYDAQWSRYQQLIDEAATAYAAWILSEPFKCIEQHDYDHCVDSGVWYLRTMVGCLRGGITDAPVVPGTADQGPSAKLWKQWLGDADSMACRALMLRQPDLLAPLRSAFNSAQDASTSGDEVNWGDREKYASTLAKLLTSDEIGPKLGKFAQDAAAEILMAANGAAERLQSHLKAGVQTAMLSINTGVMRLYRRVEWVQVRVRMTVAEYYRLQCEQLRRTQASLEKTADRNTRRQVRSIMATGLLSLEVNNEALMAKTIDVTLWLDESAGKLRQSLSDGVSDAGSSVAGRMRNGWSALAVGAATLDSRAQQLLHDVHLSPQQIQALTRRGLGFAHGARSGGVNLLLAAGGLYLLTRALKQNSDELETKLGAQHPEAVAAIYSASVGLVGGGIEAVGTMAQMLAEGRHGTQTAAGTAIVAADDTALFKAGGRLVRIGGVIGSAGGLFDATQSWKAAGRTYEAGDNRSAVFYGLSAFLSLGGAVAGGWAAYIGTTALLGPFGVALLLGLAAFALVKWAASGESTPLELWARHSCFGMRPRWPQAADASTALGALNAALLGVDVLIEFGWTSEVREVAIAGASRDGAAGVMVPCMNYRIDLPAFDQKLGAYQWSLSVTRNDGQQQLAGGASDSAAKLKPLRSKTSDCSPARILPKTTTTKSGTVLVEGTIKLANSGVGDHRITAATLQVSYWPNVNDTEAEARITLLEVR